MTTEELCKKFDITAYQISTAKHYIQLDLKNRPAVAYDRVICKDGTLSDNWVNVTEIKQVEYDREVLTKEIKKLEAK